MRLRSTFHAFLVLCMAAPVLAGCNTIGGVGRDIAAIGNMVTGAAAGTQQGVAEGFNEAAYAPAAGGTGAVASGSSAVYFALGSAQLTQEARELIRAAAADARRSNVSTVRVAGYADTSGAAEYNERLSQRRAEAVAAELEAQGVPANRISVDWHGERDLPVSTGDNTPDAQNRVVTIGL